MKFAAFSQISGMLAGAVLVLLTAPLAFAHAILVRSTPADRSVVRTGNVAMTLDYNSRIEASRCTLTLTNASGQRQALTIESAAKPSELKATTGSLANGKYLIHWQVLASDGHITRGDISFTVAHP